jgi:DNA-binding response OmpR family regulator
MPSAIPKPLATVAQSAPRVLIVCPKPVHLAVMARRIAEGGYRVATAENAKAGVAELHRQPIDLVLSDLRMPGMSGVDLVRTIRGSSAYRELPIFLITGKTDSQGAVQAYRCGADTVIAKPFHFEVLVARIGRDIERARALKRLREDNAALDARVVGRAIELSEMRERWLAAEAERRRLEELLGTGN